MSLTTRERLEQTESQMKSLANEIDAKAATGEDVTADAERLAKMMNDHAALVKVAETVTAAKALGGRVDMAAAAELASVATETKAPDLHSSGIVNPNGMTLGEAFAKSPAYQEFVKHFRGSNGAIMEHASITKAANVELPGLYGKALVTGLSDTSAGAFVTTQRLPGGVDLIGQRRLTVRDLCTNINIQSDTFDYVTVTGKTNNAAPVLEATTSATPGLNNVAVGAYGAAHGVKPESAMTFAVVSSIVETIAHFIPITRRAAADGGQVRQMVDEFLLYGLREEEEDQILNGSGTTPNLRGILNTVGINTVGSAGTDIDAVVDGIAAIRADLREPNALVVHPNDWYSTGFLTAKDSAGNYLIGDPRANLDQLNTLWGLRVVVTPAMTENTLLIGDFRQAVVADRQQATIYVSDSHNDWFVRNILAILAEERLGFGVLDPEAFCTVTAV